MESLSLLGFHLGYLQQLELPVPQHGRSALAIGSGAVGDLHEEINTVFLHQNQYPRLRACCKVVEIRNESPSVTFLQEPVQELAATEAIVQIAVTRRPPVIIRTGFEGNLYLYLYERNNIKNSLFASVGSIRRVSASAAWIGRRHCILRRPYRTVNCNFGPVRNPFVLHVRTRRRRQVGNRCNGNAVSKSLYPIWTFRLWEVLICSESGPRDASVRNSPSQFGSYLMFHP